jgi:hypothetical protein
MCRGVVGVVGGMVLGVPVCVRVRGCVSVCVGVRVLHGGVRVPRVARDAVVVRHGEGARRGPGVSLAVAVAVAVAVVGMRLRLRLPHERRGEVCAHVWGRLQRRDGRGAAGGMGSAPRLGCLVYGGSGACWGGSGARGGGRLLPSLKGVEEERKRISRGCSWRGGERWRLGL